MQPGFRKLCIAIMMNPSSAVLIPILPRPSFPRDLYDPEGIAHAFKQFQHGDSLDRDCSMASEQFASKHGCSLLTCGFFLQKNPRAVLDLDILDIDADEECLVTKNSPFYGFRKPRDEKEFISISTFMFVCLTMVCTFQSGALLDDPSSIARRGRLGLSLMLDHDGIIMDMFIKGVLKDGGKSAVAGILTGEAWIYANSEYEKIKSMSPDLSRMALFTAINIIIILLSSMKRMMAYVANTSELGIQNFI